METLRVNIAYRPLRICWAIKSGDKDSFRKAVRWSHVLWGGRFNPIVVVDREWEVKLLLEAFRVDIIISIGDSDEIKEFSSKFPYLIKPFHGGIFVGEGRNDVRCQVLDLENALTYLKDMPTWKEVKDRGIRRYTWDASDPLADLFLVQLGEFPAVEDGVIDYGQMLKDFAGASDFHISPNESLPWDIWEHPTISYLTQFALKRHYSLRTGLEDAGFYFGDSSDLDDLVVFWNLRAADIVLWFVDINNVNRFDAVIPACRKALEGMRSYRGDRFARHTAIWSRRQDEAEGDNEFLLRELFVDNSYTVIGVNEHSWNGLNIRVPMMHFSETSVLGVLTTDSGRQKISFSLSEKPFAADAFFRSQHLVASLSFIGAVYRSEDHTLFPPYIPELNEFYSRTMHWRRDRLHIESERIGLVVDAGETDAYLYALPVGDLFREVFDLAGFTSNVSSGGLITRQLISQLGGVSNARVFKIPGVRRLLKTHGPMASFTKKSAVQLIGERDPENLGVSFKDHEKLHLGPRPRGERLSPAGAFAYLVEKGLFRIGVELKCTNCQMSSWTSLDSLKQKLSCQMCGRDFDATRQLVDAEWHYRRSGVLGAERNAQGAVPVALTLQQLDANLRSGLGSDVYSVSMDLIPKDGAENSACEVDFIWMVSQPYPKKTLVVLAECKDRGFKSVKGGDGGTIDEKDIKNLNAVAKSFPKNRFDVYILLAKLCPFTPHEVELAKSINTKYSRRVILLTDRELEPYELYERASKIFKVAGSGRSVEDMARATDSIFFDPLPAD